MKDWFLILFALVLFSSIFSFVKALVSSPSGEFSLESNTLHLNWTKNYMANLTVNSTSNITIVFDNTTFLLANYSQGQGIGLIVKNNTDDFSNINTINTSESNYTNFTLMVNIYQAMPGRYEGLFFVKNVTNQSENVSVRVIVDVPIEINGSNGIGNFNGTLPENATTYQFFYFNCSAVENVTSITVYSDVENLFLLENGKLIAKSIEEGKLSYSFVNSTATYEIRIYDSDVTYNGSVILLTLNSSSKEINFETQNVTNKTITKTFNLTNEGSIPAHNVSESFELYNVKNFEGNQPKNFTIFLPNSSIIEKIKLKLVWKDEGAYNISIYNPFGEFFGSSFGKYIGSNISDVEKEEVLEVGNVARAGWWRIEVINTTEENPNYNLTIQAFVNGSKWISTNYTKYANKTFDVIGSENSTKTIQINLTTPNDAISGKYEGILVYTASNGGELKIPIKFDITTPMLVLNDSMEDMKINIKENFGVDLTRTFYLNITNLGNQELKLNFFNSSKLNCISGCNTSYFALLNFNTTEEIHPENSSLIEINISFNNSMPKNSVYEGWILITSVDEDSNLTSHPYSSFNISIKLNLTDRLNLTVIEIKSEDYGNESVNTSSKASCANVTFSLKYINGTEILPSNNLFNLSDLSKVSVKLHEPNASYFRNLTFTNVSNSTNWILNISLPANLPGGRYYVRINLTSKNLSSNPYDVYRGESLDDPINKLLIVDDMGLFMILSNYPSSLQNGTSGIVNVTIKNLGPRNATNVQIMFEKCEYISDVSFLNTSCSYIANTSNRVNFTISAYNYTGCYVAWRMIAGTTVGSCTSWIKGTSGLWFYNRSLYTEVYAPEITTTTTIPNITIPTTTTTTTITTTTTSSTTTTLPITTQPVNETFKISLITPEAPVVFNVTNINSLKILRIGITVKKNVSNVVLSLREASKPEEVASPVSEREGLVFKYLEISAVNLTEADIASVKIDFQVEKSWLSQNDIDASTISLYRYFNKSWQKLPTKRTNVTANHYLYQATSLGFSLFAIAGNKFKSFPIWIFYLVLGIVVVAILAFLFWPVKEEKTPKTKKEIASKGKEDVNKPWEELKKKWEEFLKRERKSK